MDDGQAEAFRETRSAVTSWTFNDGASRGNRFAESWFVAKTLLHPPSVINHGAWLKRRA
jgi:hypothetical protein